MKKDQSSYVNVRALSHASLQKFRHSANQPKPELHPKQILFNSKLNIKYYSNSNEQGSTMIVSKKSQIGSKNQQQLKKKIKVLEYELKKKINDHSYLVKLFKTKTNNELSHIDLYVQFNNLEQELESKNTKIKQLEEKLEESSKEVEDLLAVQNEHEGQHTNEITSFIAKLEKLQKKHTAQLTEKENLLFQERRMREEKDSLLKQIRRKYQQSQSLLTSLENQLMEAKSAKRQIEKAYEERIENTREDFLIRVQQNNKQLQKYSVRIREQEQTIKQLKQQTNNKESEKNKSLKKLQAEIIAKQKQFNELTGRLNSAEHELNSLYEQKQSYEQRERLLTEQLEEFKNRLKAQESTHNKQIQKIRKQIDSTKVIQKENVSKNERYEKELGKLQEKLAQTNATIKILHFQKEDKQIALQKLKQTLTNKQRLLQQKQKSIQDLESRQYTLQRKSNTAHERVKELQKQILSNKQTGAHHSKIEIQNYKCIGRLTELIHQIQLTISQSGYNEDTQNSGKMKMNNTRTRVKTIQNQQPQTVTECVDMLTKELQTFMKKLYPQTLSQSKQSKQLIEQIICDIKSIFHAYNSYVQDEELKGATRQYLQCLDSHEKSMRKSRNNYLQVIMERLISMIAIQSYTSENGLSRQNQSKGKFSRRRHVDSLEDTGSRWEQNQENLHKIYVEQRPIQRQQRRKTNEQSQSRYIRNDSKKKLQKLTTQPSQVQNFPIRKQLQYGKQNYMQRINMPKPENTQDINSRYSSLGQQSGYLHKYYGDNGRKIPAVKRSQIDNDEIMKQMRKDRKTIISEADIEKKYFR